MSGVVLCLLFLHRWYGNELAVLSFSDDPPFHPIGNYVTPDLISLWCEPGNYSRMAKFSQESPNIHVKTYISKIVSVEEPFAKVI
ncbi:hypothetical protein BDM02DRAFT_3124451 [Thelephora ganbajun]|uniref:Uncharacterized protein n=1 Tax=Thelephora ganbajun TaxID=370292 RepID=A0ACB6YZ69_THEGA|nr:hypothetical protein BDM02DRAFT_3124451 [Thelephora ganbajun]